MKNVILNKKDLLDSLLSNRELYVKEFEEIKKEYKIQLIESLNNLLDIAKKDPFNENITLHHARPVSYESDYHDAIAMVEMSAVDQIEISKSEFKSFVLNQWDWSNSFEFEKSIYRSK